MFVEQTIKAWHNHKDSFELKTSGSTGEPKTITLSREMLVWSAEQTFSALGLNNWEGQRSVLCCLPIQKTGGFMQLIRALHFGWHIHFVNPSSNPSPQLASYNSFFDLSSFTPTQLQSVLHEDEDLLSPQIAILIGGAAISKSLETEILTFALATNTDFWETYGMTETASHIALKKIGTDNYFKPQQGVEITLDDEQLCIAIPALDFFIKTNDIAKLYADGFSVIGRVDDVINSGGIKIHPALIEPQIAELLEAAGVYRKFYLSRKTDTILGEKAVLVLEGAPIKDEQHLLEIMKRELPAYNNPKEILFVEKIRYTDTGKIIRTTY